MHVRLAFSPYCFLFVVLTSAGPARAADDAQPGSPHESLPPASAALTVRGKVVLPDRSPAAGAAVYLFDGFADTKIATVADGAGKFEFQDPCLSGLNLYAVSADARNQAVLSVPEEAVRTYLSRPVTMILQPAKPHQLVVTAQGRPVEGARVAIAGKVSGYVSMQSGVTAADGTATVWFPAGETKIALVAWHPRHGVNGIGEQSLGHARDKTELALRSTGSHVVRLLDREGRPVDGRTLAVTISPAEGDWIMAKLIDATQATTDENGEVRWDWFPQGVKYVNVHVLDRGWKDDTTDRDQTPDGLTTVHGRRKFPVEGRLVLPDGVDAHGILITGFGFGPGRMGDRPRTRTRRDGSFALDVPAGHGYVLGAHDLEWTSDIWTGAILRVEGEPQREIVLNGEPATPLDFLVTRGQLKEPVGNAPLHVSRRAEVSWIDEAGKTRNGLAGIDGWLWTDQNGRALTGVGRGKIEINMTSGEWHETKTIDVTSDELSQIAFHRDWIGSRVLTALPTLDGKKYAASSDTIALAWTERSWVSDAIYKPKFLNDGRIAVEFDQDDVSLLVVDRRQSLSGSIKAEAGDGAVDLPMRPCATYSGTLIDQRDGAPLADRLVRLNFDAASAHAVASQRTDDMGRFNFDNVPFGVRLWVSIQDEPGRSKHSLFDSETQFQPGERRSGEVLKAKFIDRNGR